MTIALEAVLLASLVLPLLGVVGIMLADRSPDLREGITLVTAVLTFGLVLTVFAGVAGGERPEVTLFTMLPDSVGLGLDVAFAVEPLGALFALIASGLWIVNSVYSVGYMRGNAEQGQTRFYMSFAVAITAALGIAYAGNLLTFFVFYEMLTLSTFPLVTHKRDAKARAGGRIYLGVLIGTSIGLLLPAVIWTYVLAGTGDFVLGGILAGAADLGAMGTLGPTLLLGLFVFGIGKAALMPVHPWLPNAMVAPTPVSAFLHAVAVVKAGVFGVLKVSVYVFGTDYLAETGASDLFVWIAAASILIASAVAMTQDNLKARLAYSTVSQLSYVTLGAMLATSLGVIGAATQIAAHALGKMTLFMCAGAIYTGAHHSLISEMRGTGRAMSWTWTAYVIGACSIIGLPPMAGSWPKFLLMIGSLETGYGVLVAVLILSSLMNIVYLLTPAVRAFTDPLPGGGAHPARTAIHEAPILCVVPAWATALGTVALFFFMDDLVRFLEPLAAGGAP